MTPLTRQETIRLCAEAMGYVFTRENSHAPGILVTGIVNDESRYDPLTDDAQCFALVKKLKLTCTHYHVRTPHFGEHTQINEWQVRGGEPYANATSDTGDLNAAVCECAARVQLAKEGK